jgi:predicted molibdopterin-dependent oxidoreductase YjgC
LSGHFGKKNNGVIALLPHNNSVGAIDMGILPDALPGRRPATDAGMSAQDMPLRSKVLYIVGADPARENPAFRNPGFLIVQDLYNTATAQKADVILPAAAWAERDGTFTNTERRVQLFQRALEPGRNARADWEIICDVARHLGATWNYSSAADVMREIAEQIPLYSGMTHERLRVTARRRSSVQTVGGDSAEPVQIALGELFGDVSGIPWRSLSESDVNQSFDLNYVEPQAQAASPPPDQPYMAVLRSLFDHGSEVQFSEIVHPRVPAAVVELNSHDAETWNIAPGDRVKLSLAGKPPRTIQVPAHVNGMVPPGIVAVTGGLEGTQDLPMGARVVVERVK